MHFFAVCPIIIKKIETFIKYLKRSSYWSLPCPKKISYGAGNTYIRKITEEEKGTELGAQNKLGIAKLGEREIVGSLCNDCVGEFDFTYTYTKTSMCPCNYWRDVQMLQLSLGTKYKAKGFSCSPWSQILEIIFRITNFLSIHRLQGWGLWTFLNWIFQTLKLF